MKKILIAAALCFVLESCSSSDSDSSNPSAAPTNTPSNPASSASTPSVPTSAGTNTPASETKYVAEVGYICNGFDFGNVTQNNATEGYIAMYSICGDRHTDGTGATCYTATAVSNWMKSLNISAFEQVNADIATYGASFRWYNAIDGYKRYIYVEPCYDGKGLLKRTIFEKG